MKQRCITGAIIAILFAAVIIFSDTWIFNVVISALSVIAAMEIMKCTGQADKYPISVPAAIFCGLIPFVARLGSYGYITGLTVVFMFYCFFVSVFTNDEINTGSVSLVFAGACYVAVCFYSLTRIRYVPEHGFILLILVFVGAWVTDVFAYFTGFIFGKHKLIPKISPKKTIEGAIGGALFCAAAFALCGYITQVFLHRTPNYPVIIIVGIVVSVVAQLGDLTMSAVKRNYGIKDYGKLFPGHGGVLDRFDSILTIAPFLLMISGNPDFISIFK